MYNGILETSKKILQVIIHGQAHKFKQLNAFIQNFNIFFSEAFKAARIKALTDLIRKAVIEVQIMSYRKPHGEHLFRLEQMPDIRP